jgi:predicted RNA-binding Zn-ribbon protein involved in translation (DUF1610 family)
MVLREERERRRTFSRLLREEIGGPLECPTCGRAMRDYHSLSRGSYYKCKNGHFLSWGAVAQAALRLLKEKERQ